MSKAISIRSCATKEEAELLKSLLESNGVHAIISADDYVGLPLMVTGGVHLQVLKENVERAKEILEDAADASDSVDEVSEM